MKKVVIYIMIMVILSGCKSDNSTNTRLEPSPVATPKVTEPVGTPEPQNLSTPTSTKPDYDLDKSLPFGQRSLIKDDEYYYCRIKKDYTIDVYRYSKTDNETILYIDTDSENIGQILFDSNNSFYYVDWNHDVLYKCTEEEKASVIKDISCVIYIESENIYYLDTSGYIYIYNIENEISTILTLFDEKYFEFFQSTEQRNFSFFEDNKGILYSVDLRNGQIESMFKYPYYLTPDNKHIIGVEEADNEIIMTMIVLESFEKNEFSIGRNCLEHYENNSIESVLYYDNAIYLFVSIIDDENDSREYKFKNYIYHINPITQSVEKVIPLCDSSYKMNSIFDNGEWYLALWCNHEGKIEPNILIYNLATEEIKKIKIKNYTFDFLQEIEIALGCLWVAHKDVNNDIHYMDRIDLKR